MPCPRTVSGWAAQLGVVRGGVGAYPEMHPVIENLTRVVSLRRSGLSFSFSQALTRYGPGLAGLFVPPCTNESIARSTSFWPWSPLCLGHLPRYSELPMKLGFLHDLSACLPTGGLALVRVAESIQRPRENKSEWGMSKHSCQGLFDLQQRAVISAGQHRACKCFCLVPSDVSRQKHLLGDLRAEQIDAEQRRDLSSHQTEGTRVQAQRAAEPSFVHFPGGGQLGFAGRASLFLPYMRLQACACMWSLQNLQAESKTEVGFVMSTAQVPCVVYMRIQID